VKRDVKAVDPNGGGKQQKTEREIAKSLFYGWP